TLIDFYYQNFLKGENGAHGSGNNKKGKDGVDIKVNVPCGTVIKEINEDKEKIIGEVLKDGEEIIVAKGGEGGKGNTNFKSSTNQAPRIATKGKEGEEKYLKLELKLIADVGIIGYPNAGKSTFISKISNAKVKIANYPFTTLIPNLGVVQLPDFRSFVVADIPGIIEGASGGKGLGIRFLKHIERTKILVHLIDVSEPDPVSRYYKLREELEKYSKKLLEKEEIIVGNKIDIEGTEENIKILKDTFKDVYFISALTGKGINNLLEVIWNKLKG
ncbi:MAG TPA: GTPase ObgE, partial [Candidatus Ratteibacteria bacterium]|nr:GTPase ObgE [Candidatus Ratteibacteria bacterium]